MAMKMDVWQWGDVKGVDEELCNNLALYAEDNKIDYMNMTEKEFVDLKDEYLIINYGNKGVFGKKSMKESKVDFQTVIDKVIPKEYAKNKNAYKYALSCVESLYNEDEYDSDSAKVYFLNCYISDSFPSWVDELGEEEIDAFANALYDGTMKWSDIDSSWLESKKSTKKSLNEKVDSRFKYAFKHYDDYEIIQFDDYNFAILAVPNDKSLFSDDLPKFKIEKTYIYDTCVNNRDVTLFVGIVEELGWCFIAFDKLANNNNIFAYFISGKAKEGAYHAFHEYKQEFDLLTESKKSLKEGKDFAFYDGIAKEFHFSKDEKTRYKDKTYISAIAVLFDRINNAIKTYGRNSDEEYNALNDCWEVILSAKQNGFNVDYDEDRWNKIAGLPNYH